MIIKRELHIRPVQPQDRQKLANLIQFEVYVHRHLDWRQPLDWIGTSPYLVVERGAEFLASLACPPDPPQVAWIRLFAARSKISVAKAWNTLWSAALDELQIIELANSVAAISLWSWFSELLLVSGFCEANRVVMLSWERVETTPQGNHPGVLIRSMSLDDVPSVERVDAASFAPIWQNSLANLDLAYRQAAVATVAENDGEILGYQISTAAPVGGHLARLAVLPSYQGKGIGSALVQDLLWQFRRRGAQRVTVNTQKDNLASLALYRKAGFLSTGEEYPVYQCQLGK
jgi:ribosomal-protein-alanine N-acetyltransferase